MSSILDAGYWMLDTGCWSKIPSSAGIPGNGYSLRYMRFRLSINVWLQILIYPDLSRDLIRRNILPAPMKEALFIHRASRLQGDLTSDNITVFFVPFSVDEG